MYLLDNILSLNKENYFFLTLSNTTFCQIRTDGETDRQADVWKTFFNGVSIVHGFEKNMVYCFCSVQIHMECGNAVLLAFYRHVMWCIC